MESRIGPETLRTKTEKNRASGSTVPRHHSRQLEFPVCENLAMIATPANWKGCDGYGWPSAQVAAPTEFGNSTGPGGPEGRHDRQDGASLSRSAGVAERSYDAAHVPDADRSVRRGVAGGGRAAAGRAAAAGEDAVRLAAPGTPGEVLRLAAADL